MHTSVRVSPPSCIQHRAARLPRHALLQTQQTPVVPQQQISRSRRATLISIIAAATAASNSASHAADDNSQSTNPSQPITTVFVAGATGQTGSRVVKQLRQRGYNVIAGVRNPAKAAALGFDTDPGITIVPGFDVTGGVESLAAAIGDAQAVVCALGYNGGSDPQGFIDVDSKVGVYEVLGVSDRGVWCMVVGCRMQDCVNVYIAHKCTISQHQPLTNPKMVPRVPLRSFKQPNSATYVPLYWNLPYSLAPTNSGPLPAWAMPH